MRRALIIAGIVAGLIVLGWASYWRGGTGGKVTLRYWNGFTGPDGRTMLRIVKQFNAEHPDVHVLMQRMDWHTYYSKLFVARLGGRGPDVLVAHIDVLPRFERANILRAVDDLVGGPGGIDPSDIDGWEETEFGGRHLGIPLDIHLMGLYYNAGLLREAGVVDAEGKARPPTNRAEFLDAARRLTKDLDGDGEPDQWGFSFTNFRNDVYLLISQFGGRFFTDDGTRSALEDPATVEAVQFAVDLIHTHRVCPPMGHEGAAFQGFRRGEVAMVFEGIWMLPALERHAESARRTGQTVEFDGAALPQLGPQRVAWGSSHVLCLRSDLSGAKLEAAKQFIEFLSDHSLDWAAGGQLPARRSLRQTARFARMGVQSRFATQIPYRRFPPRVPFIFELHSAFAEDIEAALRGRAAPAEALRRAAEKVNEVIDRDRRVYGQAREGGR